MDPIELLSEPKPRTLLKPGDFLYDHPSNHPIFQAIGVTTANNMHEEMHFYPIGIGPMVAGSALTTLLMDMPKRNNEQNLETIMMIVRQDFVSKKDPARLQEE